MYRKIGYWDSKGSEKDIEDIKPVLTREKVRYLCVYLIKFPGKCNVLMYDLSL